MRSLRSTKALVKRLARSERGVSLVEFAIVLPLMIFMLMGLIEFGRYAFYSILAANAARAGVQYGAQSTGNMVDTTGITNAALADGQNLPSWNVTVKQLCSVGGAAPATCATSNGSTPPTNTIYYVQVQVSGTYNSLLRYPGLPASVSVSGSSLMRVIYQ